MQGTARTIAWHRITLHCVLIVLASIGGSVLAALTIVPLLGGSFDGNGLLMCVVCAFLVSAPASFHHLVQKERLRIAHDAVHALNRQLAAANRELAERATRDGLSQLLNRTEFHRQLGLQPEAAGGALYIVDIDDFKSVNDRNGHLVGDGAIRAVANCLTEALPREALIARTGGDEFCVFIQRADMLEGWRLARKMADDVAALPLRNGAGAAVPLSVCIGYVVLPTLPADREELIDRADRALYRAKAAGRGRVAPGREDATVTQTVSV